MIITNHLIVTEEDLNTLNLPIEELNKIKIFPALIVIVKDSNNKYTLEVIEHGKIQKYFDCLNDIWD